MTSARSEIDDNGGRCESCDRPESIHMAQTTYPVLLGGEIGWGTMWLCPDCLKKHKERDRRDEH